MSITISSTAPFLPALPSLHLNRGRNLVSGLAVPRSLSQALASTNVGSGLRTPPIDDMSAAYQPAVAYNGHHSRHPCSATLAQANHLKPVVDDVRAAQQYRYPSQQIQPQRRDDHHSPSAQLADTTGPHASDPVTPVSAPAETTKMKARTGSETLIYHSLQLPACISPTGGNLSDFAAQMTCLFWFESIDELKNAESIRLNNHPSISRLPALANPHEQFQKWVYNVLSTTQVTQNVIFLALLFIYRLKMSTPQIKGRSGSEYRLLTVALMLGNKFLDDNTYTNKTWAEVSCFAVQEIHIMEVEFLSNMRYNLLASKDEWEEWIMKLASFREYYERASKLAASPTPISKHSPAHRAVHSPVPSPTKSGFPSYTSSIQSNLSPSSRQTQNGLVYPANATSPLARKISIAQTLPRKRSPETNLAEHPAKRHAHAHAQPAYGSHVLQAVPSARPSHASRDNHRLPVPHLSLVTNQQLSSGNVFTNLNATNAQQMVSLPPLQSGTRAMCTVYQSSPGAQGVQHPSAAVPVTATSASAPIPPTVATSYPMATLQTQAGMGYGTPTKHHSPGRLLPNYGSSPLVESFGPSSTSHTPVVHTPISNSPSVYLQHRASPYKPIRNVNRLLYPPPSASLDQYHISIPVHPNQMHYQPIGRRYDLRTGIVPEFLMYNRGHQQHLSSQGMPQGHYPS
ncbi:hypothetical protein E4U42_005556 [Claviceps africana]|uniref:Cyclin n=1 Tax=Claviceps africana TaxID=83212 RepID=A0A8K0NJ31_9HYPO|nr:hypothetical protein E4U42_005556 [Claviceps africana]